MLVEMVEAVSMKIIDSSYHELTTNNQIIDLVAGASEGMLSASGNQNARFLI